MAKPFPPSPSGSCRGKHGGVWSGRPVSPNHSGWRADHGGAQISRQGPLTSGGGQGGRPVGWATSLGTIPVCP